MNAWGHFKTITSHKFLVMKYCFKVGLYKQGFLHDLSKYSPTEFMVGAKYYQGTRSPNNAEREATGVSTSWLHHKGRNKHHFEYWVDYGIGAGKEDVFIYVIYNMHWNEHKFALPDIPEGMRWYLAIDSSKKNSVCPKGKELLLEEKKSIYVKPRTILVLLGDARESGAKA